jgi:hypothetical protein
VGQTDKAKFYQAFFLSFIRVAILVSRDACRGISHNFRLWQAYKDGDLQQIMLLIRNGLIRHLGGIGNPQLFAQTR